MTKKMFILWKRKNFFLCEIWNDYSKFNSYYERKLCTSKTKFSKLNTEFSAYKLVLYTFSLYLFLIAFVYNTSNIIMNFRGFWDQVIMYGIHLCFLLLKWMFDVLFIFIIYLLIQTGYVEIKCKTCTKYLVFSL